MISKDKTCFQWNKKHKVEFLVIIIIILMVFLYWQNNQIVISRFTYSGNEVTKEMKGFKLLQVSDLHNKEFHQQLVNKVRNESPDIILITGDIVDSRRTNIQVAIDTAKELVAIAPTYYITGNHESRIKDYATLEVGLETVGVVLLLNGYETISIGNESIRLIGLQDPSFYGLDSRDISMQKHMKQVVEESKIDGMNLLISHRPEIMDLYDEMEVNLVFSGHAHGGQIRIPFLGGIIAPNQGLFPKYNSGRYDGNHATMFVSRGLGNSLFPFRIFNRPELVVVTLVNKQ